MLRKRLVRRRRDLLVSRVDQALSVAGAVTVAAIVGGIVWQRRENRIAAAAEARSVAAQMETGRAAREADEARAASERAAQVATQAELAAYRRGPEVARRVARALLVAADTGMQSDLDGERLDILALRDPHCIAQLYRLRMVPEPSLNTTELQRLGFRSVRCNSPLGECSMIDLSSGPPEPQRCP